MIHMPKGANVLKDLLSHKEKLKKAASSVKLSEECSAVIQRSLPQKEGDPGSFTLPCLIGPLAVKNTLANLGASINLMTHSLFLRLGIFELKPTRMSIQLVDRSFWKWMRTIILGRPFFATARAVIDIHEGKLSLRVKNETVTFNIGKYMRYRYSRNDYLYCADHTAKLVHEQWVDTVDHDGKWIETEKEDNPEEIRAVSFYPRQEPIEPLEWKALEIENEQLPVVISSTLSAHEKTKLLEIPDSSQGRITPTLQYLVYSEDESNYNYCMMYKNQKYDIDNAMEMRNKPGSAGSVVERNRPVFFNESDQQSSRESKNTCGEVGGVEKMSSAGSKFIVRGEEYLEGCVGAGGGEINEGRYDFGVSKSLLGEILGVVIGESGGVIFRDDGGVVW
ncbi:hypothetical protein Tco_0415852 [Tanacetum coccineum]